MTSREWTWAPDELAQKAAAVRHASAQCGEDRDCVVRAMALAFDLPYQEAHKLCAQYGRKRRRAMYMGSDDVDGRGWMELLITLADERGFTVCSRARPPWGKTIRSLAPRLRRDRVFLVHTARHLLCIRGGRALDHTAGRMHRVKFILELVPRG